MWYVMWESNVMDDSSFAHKMVRMLTASNLHLLHRDYMSFKWTVRQIWEEMGPKSQRVREQSRNLSQKYLVADMLQPHEPQCQAPFISRLHNSTTPQLPPKNFQMLCTLRKLNSRSLVFWPSPSCGKTQLLCVGTKTRKISPSNDSWAL